MTIAEQLIRAKTDYDAVYEAGKQAEYDAFWDVFQENGSRDDYYVAFYSTTKVHPYWTDDNFKPKYPIRPIRSAQSMLQCSSISGDLTKKVEIDFSNAQGVTSAFAYCSNLTRIGILDFRKVSSGRISTTEYCTGLETIDEFIFKEDGTQFGGTTGLSATSCSSLKNVKITGKINFSVNFQYSPLTKESITSVVNALWEGSSGKTVTFKKSAKEAAFTEDEWAALISDKTNWTFSLV